MSLDRQHIIETSLTLLDQTGLEGLTMRRLAEALGVQAPALYWHFPNKTALLDDMAEAMVSSIAASIDVSAAYPEVLRRMAVALRKVLLSRRDGARLFAGTFVARENMLEVSEILISAMLRGGFDARTATRAVFSLGYFIMGFVIEEQALEEQMRASGGVHPILEKLWEQPAGGYEDTRAVLPELIETDQDARFAFGVDLILRGLADLHDRRSAASERQ